MQWLLIIVGVAVIGVVMWDVVVTALAVTTSAGPLTGRLTHALWAAGLRVGGDRVLQTLGVGLALLTIMVWLFLLWAAWTVIFAADPSAVVVTGTGEPAGLWDRAYFAGYTLFTLGNGDLRPAGAPWQLATVLAVLNGLGVASLGITYLVPVTSAASDRRRLAATISGLGDRPDDLLTRAWNGSDFELLPEHLVRLTPDIDLLAQRHLTYPVLHFFHSRETHAAAAVAVARMDEAVTLLRAGVDEGVRVPASALEPLHTSLTRFLDTLRSAFIGPTAEEPPLPSLDGLRRRGIPTVDDGTFARRLGALRERRAALLGLVLHDGRDWADVWGMPDDDPQRETPQTESDTGAGGRSRDRGAGSSEV